MVLEPIATVLTCEGRANRVMLIPGPLADASRGAGPAVPGADPGPTVVPLPGHLPCGRRNHKPHPGGPAGPGLPHTEGDPTTITTTSNTTNTSTTAV